MEQNDLEQKNITIAGIEDKGWGIALTDEKGLKYNISKMLKDGSSETKAFQVLKTLAGYGMGLKKCVKFATVPNSQGGQSRYVRIIGEVEEMTDNATSTHKTPNLSLKTPKTPITEPDWDKIAVGKVRHGVALEAIKKDMELNLATDKWIKDWTDYIMTGELNLDNDLGINTDNIF